MTSDISWRKFAFRVQDYVNLTNIVQLKFIASDSTRLGQYLDGGSLIEAAVDDFSLYEELTSSNVNDINSSTKDKKLINITDLLGREVDLSTIKEEITLLYIYDDGSIEKKVYLDY